MNGAGVQKTAFRAMSVQVEITGVGAPDGAVAAAGRFAADLAADWEAHFSRFRPDSMLCRLNAADGSPVAVDDLFLDLVGRAAAAVARTGGRFDPAILPALEAAGYDESWSRIDPERDRRAAPAVPSPGPAAWRAIRRDRWRGTVALPPGMRLDVGGIGKGMFVDLLAHCIRSWPGGCIDAGGDLFVWGASPDGDGWAIGIEDPAAPDHDLLVARVPAGATLGVATSGGYRRRWRAGGAPAHHLIDPATGQPLPASGPCAATAFAATVTDAEIATKALLVAAAN
ncbi:MAG TPA: FAD:protein FMN transferase, partial [Thermomicrobiales bacterium]|nr:FAD:protein FMN transferase [Thermomicrobiales bacterium]